MPVVSNFILLTFRRVAISLGALVLLCILMPPVVAHGQSPFSSNGIDDNAMEFLAPGLERGLFDIERPAHGLGDSTLVVLRIDPT